MSRTWKDRSYGANVRAARKHGWKLDPDAKALVDEKPVDIEGYHETYERYVNRHGTQAEAEAAAAEYAAKHAGWKTVSAWPRRERRRVLSAKAVRCFVDSRGYETYAESATGDDERWKVIATVERESEPNLEDPYGVDDDSNSDIEGYAASMRSVNSKLARSIEASCSPDRDHDCGWCHENRVHRDRKRGYVDDADLEDIPVDHIPGDLKNDEYRRPVN